MADASLTPRHDHRAELKTASGKQAYEAVREVVWYGVTDRFPGALDLVDYVGDRLLELEAAASQPASPDLDDVVVEARRNLRDGNYVDPRPLLDAIERLAPASPDLRAAVLDAIEDAHVEGWLYSGSDTEDGTRTFELAADLITNRIRAALGETPRS